jgi:AraC family transcriptional regulator
LENIALGERGSRTHDREVSGSLTVQLTREGRVARLSELTCTLGPLDKPYPETHQRDAWTIALVRRGNFRYRAGDTNRVHSLRAGWLVLGRPGGDFECSHDHDGGDDCASLVVSHDLLTEVAAATKGHSGPMFPSPVAPPLPRVAALLERARSRHDADLDEIAYLVAEAVVVAAHQSQLEDVARHPSHLARINDAIDLIEASCRRSLSLSDLAAPAGLSPFHFLRVFRRVTGTTPHQYLIGARLRLAARLLLDTSQPVTQIAYEVGFDDLSNFVRTFHRVIGCSPREYRRVAPNHRKARFR